MLWISATYAVVRLSVGHVCSCKHILKLYHLVAQPFQFLCKPTAYGEIPTGSNLSCGVECR